MSPKKIVALFSFLALLFWTAPAFSENDSSRPSLLQKVQVDSSSHGLSIGIKFSQPVESPTAQFFKKSIQLDIPGGRIEPDQRYFSTGDSEIVRIYASQAGSGMARIRLILAESVPDAEQRFHFERQGRLLKIEFDKLNSDSLGSLLARATQIKKREEESLAQEFQAANRIESKTKAQSETPRNSRATFLPGKSRKEEVVPQVKKQIAPIPTKRVKNLSEVVGNESPPEMTSPKEKKPPIKDSRELLAPVEATVQSPDMWSASLKMFYALAMVLGIVFLLYFIVKKFFWKNGVFGNESKPIKILSTGFLAPKKSIALVEIPGEVLVLGIAHENISLLGNIREPDQISRIKGQPPQPSELVAKVPESPIMEEKEEEKPGEGVDLYQSKRKKPATTNPFPEYVKRFAEHKPRNSASVTQVTSQIRRNLRRVRTK